MACSPAALVLNSASSQIFSPRWRCSAWGGATIDYFLFIVDFWKTESFVFILNLLNIHVIWYCYYIVLNMSSYFTCWSFWTSFRPRTSFESCFDILSKFCSILSASTFLINNMLFFIAVKNPLCIFIDFLCLSMSNHLCIWLVCLVMSNHLCIWFPGFEKISVGCVHTFNLVFKLLSKYLLLINNDIDIGNINW